MDINFKGKVAIVIGASRGIGKAIATMFAENGANTVVASRSKKEIISVSKELQSKKYNSLHVQVDVSKIDSVKELFNRTIKEYGKIDILVNAAGVTIRKPATELSEKEWDHVIDINLKGIYNSCKTALDCMVSNKYGKIINIASTASFLGIKDISPYCASKAGVMGLTRSLAVEYGKYNINVNAIAPGYVKTELTEKLLNDPSNYKRIINRTPINRLGKPEDIGALTAFLSSDLSSYITGEIIFIDGGYTICGS